MKVLITGANGLLATNTIDLFLKKGYFVKGLIRDKKKFLLKSHPNLELVEADILDFTAVEKAMVDCNAVVHIAALTAQNILEYNVYHKVNVTGTVNMVKAAVKLNVQKFIYVSSANTMGYGDINNPGTEENPPKPPFTDAFYPKSKTEAEEKLLSYSEKIDIIRVNPTFMLGPYDSKPSSGQIILMGLNKRVVFFPPGGKNFVDVRDAAKGILSALENGRPGEAYLLANSNMSYKDFFTLLKRRGNKKKMLMLKIPKNLLLLTGHAGDILRLLKIKTSLSSVNMKILCVSNYYSGDKSQRELGLKYQPIENAVDDAIKWFRNNNMI
ncbi:NAD-dependent epimerase/dehydratase family protein [Autumnicola musiva]|uniref:NAD-dependent epimerase/dehydratase family protein n=1 Tax=Autumnicola musiva TaxID=3075589 RepID=A0ABU3D558_9FLAO|nr:NAD-dependent epimerase/dehydratase family protein [Zunongwangia sp. F117]MDT0676667.1 NAD-dependent epimerase/dehydratase family protein [Zunongwangia sp. F117]